MARKLLASKTFIRENDDKCIGSGSDIGNSLTLYTADFKNLLYKGDDLLKKNDDLSRASNVAKSGDCTAKSELKVVRTDWKTKFGDMADTVSLEANGSESLKLKADMNTTSSSKKNSSLASLPIR